MWSCSPSEPLWCVIVHSNSSTSMVLPPLSSILFLTSSQSRIPLPRVIEPPPPSPTSTEGPDATDSECTASSSSSTFSFSSSSSFYATSSSSTSDKVSPLDTLNSVGRGLLVWKLLAFLLSFSFRSLVRHKPCTESSLLFATFPLLLSLTIHLNLSSFPVIFIYFFPLKNNNNPNTPCW